MVDLPGVNAQERTKSKLIESLRIGAEEMLAVEVPFEPEAVMTTITVPDPQWVDVSNGWHCSPSRITAQQPSRFSFLL